jgi:hypothetical protein
MPAVTTQLGRQSADSAAGDPLRARHRHTTATPYGVAGYSQIYVDVHGAHFIHERTQNMYLEAASTSGMIASIGLMIIAFAMYKDQ